MNEERDLEQNRKTFTTILARITFSRLNQMYNWIGGCWSAFMQWCLTVILRLCAIAAVGDWRLVSHCSCLLICVFQWNCLTTSN